MNRKIFSEWLLDLNEKCVHEKCQILLLLDNFSGQKLDLLLSNVQILMLPPNSTSKCQPLDQGIIYRAKVNYKKFLVNFYWNRYQLSNCRIKFEAVNLLQAIRFLRDSWDLVKSFHLSRLRRLTTCQSLNFSIQRSLGICSQLAIRLMISFKLTRVCSHVHRLMTITLKWMSTTKCYQTDLLRINRITSKRI